MEFSIENKLRENTGRLIESSRRFTPELQADASRLRQVIDQFELAWSGSSMGYHANVYYENFALPPAGAHFTHEWGLKKPYMDIGSIGDWVEYDYQSVIDRIFQAAGNPNLEAIENASEESKREFSRYKNSFYSLASQISTETGDAFISKMQMQADELRIPNVQDATRFLIRQGEFRTADTVALSQGFKPAPHQELLARLVVAMALFKLCTDLAEVCDSLADHVEIMANVEPQTSRVAQGKKIFIGHGHSEEWRKLKEYLTEGLGLQCEEYSRVANAGRTITVRLTSMLEAAQFAFIVMTAEDEAAGGEKRARENVVHEAGLFQGRLGFERAILVSEKTCHIFSNIHGLERIDFSTGNIKEAFSEVHAVLVREGVLSKP